MIFKNEILTHFMTLVSFYNSSLYQKASGFLMFSGDIDRDHKDKMDLPFSSQCSLLTPLKTLENLWFSDVFRGIKREHWEEKG